MYYVKNELRNIHRPFFHSHADKRVSRIHRGAKKYETPQLLERFERVRQSCDICQRLSEEVSRFRAATPKERRMFYKAVGMDDVKIGNKSILHTKDHVTKFGAAAFLQKETS